LSYFTLNEKVEALVIPTHPSTSQEPPPPPAQEPLADVEIAVNRVSIDDPLFQHRYQWGKIVLPRLCSFVDAVYRIRACDEKRYRLLMAMASSSLSTQADAWKLLHEECPWLQYCDTAFLQELGVYGKIQ
jgi:hypothetical protein